MNLLTYNICQFVAGEAIHYYVVGFRDMMNRSVPIDTEELFRAFELVGEVSFCPGQSHNKIQYFFEDCENFYVAILHPGNINGLNCLNLNCQFRYAVWLWVIDLNYLYLR